jgi:hypothetical protein
MLRLRERMPTHIEVVDSNTVATEEGEEVVEETEPVGRLVEIGLK